MAANNDIHWCVSMVADDEKMETEADLQDLYTWIDEIPLSRPKKNITRDFSDGGDIVTFVTEYLCFNHMNFSVSFGS